MADKSINLLPKVPESFCFQQNELSTREFEADLFIRKHQNNMPLEQLREDLSIYLRNLRLSLVDLINCDYEEFIHLTSNYIDLNNNINSLTYSLSKLKSDVEKSNEEIQSTIDKLNENLDYIRMTLKQKKDLHFILKASKMIDNIETDLEAVRLANGSVDPNFNKVAYQLNLINQKLGKLSLNSTYVSQTFKAKVESLNQEMDEYLDGQVGQFIREQNSKGIGDLLENSVLNQQYDQLVELIFNKVFKRKLQDFICDLNIDKHGILNFFDQLFDICASGLSLFKNINTVGVNLADHLIDRASEKIYTDLTINASTLFLAGNPETFILNFKETIGFFRRLLSLNSTSRSPEQFRIFNEIKRKFNCEIYFHIRLSEASNEVTKALERPILLADSTTGGQTNSQIASQLGNQMSGQATNQFAPNQSSPYGQQPNIKIQLVDELLRILNFIWSDQIYLNTLFFDFWRLTLLLIARYTLFLKQFQFNALGVNGGLQTNYQLQSLILIRLINESAALINSIQQIYSSVIKPRMPANCNEFELTTCLNQSFDTLFTVGLPPISLLLKQVFCMQCLAILNQIKEIPRLYRKTNRDVPSRPSAYIVNCVELFQQLKQIQKGSAGLLLEILNEVTSNFYSLTNEVLESLQKMEESLMRLKKVQTANGNLKSLDKKTTMSDADKIRLQFKLDVNFYCSVSNLNVLFPEI